MRALLSEQSNVSNHKAIKNDKLYSQYSHRLQHCLFQGCHIIVFPHWLLILLACLRIELFSLVPSLCSLPRAAPPAGHFLKAEKFISFRETFFLLFQCNFSSPDSAWIIQTTPASPRLHLSSVRDLILHGSWDMVIHITRTSE